MTEQNLIIFNLPVIFDVLNEIKDNLNFKISKVNSKNELKKKYDNLLNNSMNDYCDSVHTFDCFYSHHLFHYYRVCCYRHSNHNLKFLDPQENS